MVYLPASRAVDTVGMHPMFYGRVSGVGSQMPGGPSPYEPDWTKVIPQVPIVRTQVCPPVCPEGYVPPGQSPPTAKPTASALPLLLGAAFLLLS